MSRFVSDSDLTDRDVVDGQEALRRLHALATNTPPNARTITGRRGHAR